MPRPAAAAVVSFRFSRALSIFFSLVLSMLTVSLSCLPLVDFYAKNRDMECTVGIFEEMPTKDPIPMNCLITGYSKSGDVEKVRKLFDDMTRRTPASWNSMIAYYAHGGEFTEALRLFDRMLSEGRGQVNGEWRKVVSSFICNTEPSAPPAFSHSECQHTDQRVFITNLLGPTYLVLQQHDIDLIVG
ncbi:hypothetical protein GUJ93_ZPchr0010g7599 [Zizania palustris]|uniref:Pentatricopeptide repeat-containing protein n=1 Tax=Zizania palustris TaxID=103762 RepID=A0A8J5WCT8_ZIZPA|nr:hypothetical protein GUJ93_ZPchr0010g7599 [Zizania palustris]